MKHSRRLIPVLILAFFALCAFGQQPATKTPKPPTKPVARLSDSFAKAGLKALLAIQDERYDATEVMEDAEVAVSAKSDEHMFRLLQDYKVRHDYRLACVDRVFNQTWPIVSAYPDHPDEASTRETARESCANAEQDSVTKEGLCVSELKKAFRNRTNIAAPADCK